jgi:hypothetical protein
MMIIFQFLQELIYIKGTNYPDMYVHNDIDLAKWYLSIPVRCESASKALLGSAQDLTAACRLIFNYIGYHVWHRVLVDLI